MERNNDFTFEQAGFSSFSGKPNPRQHHRHDEVELAIFERGSLVALYGGRQMTVPPGRLVVLWGAMPHRTLRLLGDTVGHGLRVPLPWVLRWKLPEGVVQRLLTTTGMKLLDIAAESGFNSPARFDPCFKRLVGQSPARYPRCVHAATSADP